MWILVYVGTGAFARPAKRSEASRHHDPRKLNHFTSLPALCTNSGHEVKCPAGPS